LLPAAWELVNSGRQIDFLWKIVLGELLKVQTQVAGDSIKNRHLLAEDQ